MTFSKKAISLNQLNQVLRTAETIMTVIGMTEATEIGEVDSVQTRKGGIEVVPETTVDVAEAEDIDIRLYFYWYVVCNIAWYLSLSTASFSSPAVVYTISSHHWHSSPEFRYTFS